MKYLIPVLLIILFSCQSKPGFGPETAKKEIRAILTEQQKAWNRNDIETYMQGYYKSDSLRFASGGHVSYGWETTLNRYKKGYPDKAAMGTLTFSKIDIKMLSETSALVFGKWELERAGDHPWGLFTLIFRKAPCGWRIVHDHTSSDK
ncbi:MAG: DUF4440 domain-containing protein [Bacteroidetes bacterium]|nr:MAG: DUF4440 domain-containing protein [Bacteroidota bacterium]RLD85504.1 MAG: DUF4440 domain-containing protein [Bacteroidota bacterium]